jgi:hypothetical protein
MPFCRECGKEVQDDWKLCPYCESRIGPPSEQNSSSQSADILLQDSVMTGDVTTTINDPKSISTAVQEASKCPHCASSGVTIISCSGCDSMAYCSICQEEVFEERRSHFKSDLGLQYSEGGEEDLEKELTRKRLCEDCYINARSNDIEYNYCSGCKRFAYFNTTCWSCKKSYCDDCGDSCNSRDSGIIGGSHLHKYILNGGETPPLPEDYEFEMTPGRRLVSATDSTYEKYGSLGFCFKEKLNETIREQTYVWGCREDE